MKIAYLHYREQNAYGEVKGMLEMLFTLVYSNNISVDVAVKIGVWMSAPMSLLIQHGSDMSTSLV